MDKYKELFEYKIALIQELCSKEHEQLVLKIKVDTIKKEFAKKKKLV